MRWARSVAGLAISLTICALVVTRVDDYEIHQLSTQVDQLQQEKTDLLQQLQRLTSSRRLAQAIVLTQRSDADGNTLTRLLWQELDVGGALSAPLQVDVVGTDVYFEAMVVKFEPRFVTAGDAERGFSVALFRRIFGDQQAPRSVPELWKSAAPSPDAPKRPVTHGAPIWDRFWQIVEDPKLAEEYGIRVAQLEAPAVPLKPGQVWEATIDAAGGLNLKRLDPTTAPATVPTTDSPSTALP